MFEYPVTLAKDGTGFLVTFKDVPEAITFGETEAHALAMAVDALESALSFYVDNRLPLPKPRAPKRGQKTVSPTALECAKLGVYSAMLEQGVKKAELARRLGWHAPQVDRLFDLKHKSKFEQLEMAAEALGKQIQLVVK